MDRCALRSEADLSAAIAACRDALDRHGVVAIPTETFYGLAVRPDDRDAVEALLVLKGRPAEKALPLVAAGLVQVEALVVLPEAWVARLAAAWPAPLSVVAPVRRPLAACGASAAVRVPDHALLRALLRELGPLTATSANRSGEAAPTSLEGFSKHVRQGLTLALDGGSTPGGRPSTLLDVMAEPPKLLREGAFLPPLAWGVKGA